MPDRCLVDRSGEVQTSAIAGQVLERCINKFRRIERFPRRDFKVELKEIQETVMNSREMTPNAFGNCEFIIRPKDTERPKQRQCNVPYEQSEATTDPDEEQDCSSDGIEPES